MEKIRYTNKRFLMELKRFKWMSKSEAEAKWASGFIEENDIYRLYVGCTTLASRMNMYKFIQRALIERYGLKEKLMWALLEYNSHRALRKVTGHYWHKSIHQPRGRCQCYLCANEVYEHSYKLLGDSYSNGAWKEQEFDQEEWTDLREMLDEPIKYPVQIKNPDWSPSITSTMRSAPD